mgnify:CR=1 FL=1
MQVGRQWASTAASPLPEGAGKVALVTGASSGIGLGAAEALATAGYSVGMIAPEARDGSHVQAVASVKAAAEEAGAGGNVVFVPAWLGESEAAVEAVATITAELGNVSVLVNNAGIQHVAPVHEFSDEMWNKVLAVNLSAPFHMTRAVLPDMIDAEHGRIINVASAHALVASPYKSAYVATKHGLLGFTKSVALEVADKGITVNAVCPGYVLTPLVEKQIPDTAKARGISEEEVVRDVILAAQPSKKFVSIDEVVSMIMYLASSAARSVTGTSLTIDGGWTAR